jgi:hypothetical protein
MRWTPPPPAPSTDDQLVVRVQLTISDAEVNATVIVQRPRARRRLAAITDRLPELIAGAIVGVLVEHLAALLTTLL